MSPEPFDSRAKAPPAKRWEKGCGDENGTEQIEERNTDLQMTQLREEPWCRCN